MISNVKTISLIGIEGNLVEVQTDITGGLPSFDIVGLPDTSVRESKERIKSKINSKDPVLEILDEDDDYEKPIIIGVAKK